MERGNSEHYFPACDPENTSYLKYESPSWITALLARRGLHNSMKLWAMLCQATQEGRVTVKSSDKTWSTGRDGNPIQYSYLENFMDSTKRQKDTMPEDEAPQVRRCPSNMLLKSVGQLPTAPVRMKWLGQSRNDAQLWMYLVVKLKSSAVKNSIALESGLLGTWIKVNWTWSSRRWQK